MFKNLFRKKKKQQLDLPEYEDLYDEWDFIYEMGVLQYRNDLHWDRVYERRMRIIRNDRENTERLKKEKASISPRSPQRFDDYRPASTNRPTRTQPKQPETFSHHVKNMGQGTYRIIEVDSKGASRFKATINEPNIKDYHMSGDMIMVTRKDGKLIGYDTNGRMKHTI